MVIVIVALAMLVPSQTERIKALEDKLLAPCCYSEPVSRHRSEVALQMRAEIGRWVAEGKSDREIVDTYKRRYGARVLIEPEGGSRWLVHTVPIAAFIAGLVLTALLVRRMAAKPGPPATSTG
jgi:cytochrome c-type biogenesis protein CcmH/NrfF